MHVWSPSEVERAESLNERRRFGHASASARSVPPRYGWVVSSLLPPGEYPGERSERPESVAIVEECVRATTMEVVQHSAACAC